MNTNNCDLCEVTTDELETVAGGFDFGLGALLQLAASSLEGKATTTPTSRPVSGTSSYERQNVSSTRISDAYAQQRQ